MDEHPNADARRGQPLSVPAPAPAHSPRHTRLIAPSRVPPQQQPNPAPIQATTRSPKGPTEGPAPRPAPTLANPDVRRWMDGGRVEHRRDAVWCGTVRAHTVSAATSRYLLALG